MTEEEFNQFVEEATAYLRSGVAGAKEKWDVGSFDDYRYDLETNEFWWSNGGVRKVVARPIVVGSISTKSGTWLWSWANPSFEGVDMEEIESVKAFGAEHGINKLVESKWSAEEVDGWEMTALAARLLESECAYRCPTDNGFLFLLLTNLRKAE